MYFQKKGIARSPDPCEGGVVLGGTAALRVPYGLGGLQFFCPNGSGIRADVRSRQAVGWFWGIEWDLSPASDQLCAA